MWFHGSQFDKNQRLLVKEGPICASCCWLADSMPCVLMTPFGSPVEPEVKRNFATVSARRDAAACSRAGPGRVRSRESKPVTPSMFAVLRLATISAFGPPFVPLFVRPRAARDLAKGPVSET